ncbi:MAG: GTPase HflX [Spirochaetota bacterium]
MRNRALLCAVRLSHVSDEDLSYSLQELSELSTTAGFTIVDIVVQNRSDIDVAYFIGKGKISEIAELWADKADVLIFNHDLSPSQARNVEKVTGLNVRTRTEIILDIFAVHARTKSAKLQVQMAKLSYEMPRIIGKGIEMSRIEGGIHMKGLGEQQLELDRRKIRKKIADIKAELEEISVERENQRKRRVRGEKKIAIVGYTNSGKSTLINRLTKSNVTAQNKLFVTLDTTTRKLWLGNNLNAVITDTVGFIRDIPHGLIESFRSTFEDALSADLLVHVVDLSAPDREEKKAVADATVRDMGGGDIPVLVCFNKIDLVPDHLANQCRLHYPDALFISAAGGEGISELRDRIISMLTDGNPEYGDKEELHS